MQPTAEHASRFQFSLGTLLLVVTLFAMWLTLLMTVPCVAVAVLVFLFPALARTMYMLHLFRCHDELTSVLEKLSILAACMMLMLFIYILTLAAAIASVAVGSMLYFLVEQVSGGKMADTIWEALGIIAIAGVTILFSGYVAIWLMWRSWPRYSESLRYEYF